MAPLPQTNLSGYLNTIQRAAPQGVYLHRTYTPHINKTIEGYQRDIHTTIERHVCHIANMHEYTINHFMSDYVIHLNFALHNQKYRRHIQRTIASHCRNARTRTIFMTVLESEDVYTGHQVVILYKPTGVAYLFDPSNILASGMFPDSTHLLYDLFGDLCAIPGTDLLYISSFIAHDEIEGYCLVWCVLFVDCYCKFGHVNSPEAIVRAFHSHPKGLDALVRAYSYFAVYTS